MNQRWGIFFFFLILITFLSFSLQADLRPKGKRFVGFTEGSKAFGIFVGEPMAARAYFFNSWRQAFGLSLGYSFAKTLQGSADYLFYGMPNRDKVIDQDFWNNLLFYGGPGVLFGAGLSGSDKNNSFQAALRAVGGGEYVFTDSPLSLRLELAPQFFLRGTETFVMSVGVGLTYYLDEGKPKAFKRGSKKVEPPPSELEEFE